MGSIVSYPNIGPVERSTGKTKKSRGDEERSEDESTGSVRAQPSLFFETTVQRPKRNVAHSCVLYRARTKCVAGQSEERSHSSSFP
jgi:hypothetical protein